MKEKKKSFFIRVKNAIMNFDEYQNFAEEKTIISIKYIIKLIVIFSVILTALITYEFTSLNKIVSTENETIDNMYQKKSIVFLKNDIVINYFNTNKTITYDELNNLTGLSKENVINYTNNNNIFKVGLLTLAFLCLYFFATVMIDILLLSILGILMGRIFGIKFKYKQMFNISIYALTLSVVLYFIYVIANLLTGYTITYFRVAYDSISYIYLITAILIIKSELIKRQIEVMKIVKEQEKIAKPKEEEPEEEEPETEDKTKKKKEKTPKAADPEGSKA